uniref:beta-ketoacyl synthase N-terminal-like domain-containing protein n=1 Tax=Aquimarina aggregata TaxID=1642818 RepID=UPI00248FC9B9
LNLKGPCITIDTACSSSLVALSQACDSLQSGASEIALAGGVFIGTTPELHIMASQSGMLSRDGKCHTFDDKANGFVPGEGVGVVLLKPLSAAEHDGDHIYGVIEGWGVNQDGATNGITAPSADSQEQLELEVYDRFGINPSTISYVEAHGTGTQLGDPIEFKALTNAFRKYTDKTSYCGLGSVKTNMGHALTAAGISGLLKVLLSMKYRQLPPSLHFNQANPHINIEDSPFYVLNELQDWGHTTPDTPLRAAVSSFGFSGTNSHVVVRSYTEQKYIASIPSEGVLIPLSAKDKESLLRYANKMLNHLKDAKHSNTISLVDLGWTLQEGRKAMEERLVIKAESIADVIKGLQNYI